MINLDGLTSKEILSNSLIFSNAKESSYDKITSSQQQKYDMNKKINDTVTKCLELLDIDSINRLLYNDLKCDCNSTDISNESVKSELSFLSFDEYSYSKSYSPPKSSISKLRKNTSEFAQSPSSYISTPVTKSWK